MNNISKILVVDDNPDMVVMLKNECSTFFKEAQVDTAASGQAALEMIREDGYDLLITDMECRV